MPSSSCNSRSMQVRSSSSGRFLPPGNSQTPPKWSSYLRWVIRTLPSFSTTPTPTILKPSLVCSLIAAWSPLHTFHFRPCRPKGQAESHWRRAQAPTRSLGSPGDGRAALVQGHHFTQDLYAFIDFGGPAAGREE